MSTTQRQPKCEMCGKRLERTFLVVVLGCDAELCKRDMERLRADGHEVKIAGELRKVY